MEPYVGEVCSLVVEVGKAGGINADKSYVEFPEHINKTRQHLCIKEVPVPDLNCYPVV
jgi:hypothetical protein